jgi:hypothetical protein
MEMWDTRKGGKKKGEGTCYECFRGCAWAIAFAKLETIWQNRGTQVSKSNVVKVRMAVEASKVAPSRKAGGGSRSSSDGMSFSLRRNMTFSRNVAQIRGWHMEGASGQPMNEKQKAYLRG